MDTGEENYAILENFERFMHFDDEETSKSRNGRKIHEYEAIWLSSKKPTAIGSETVGENTDCVVGVETKDSVFVQKSECYCKHVGKKLSKNKNHTLKYIINCVLNQILIFFTIIF